MLVGPVYNDVARRLTLANRLSLSGGTQKPVSAMPKGSAYNKDRTVATLSDVEHSA